MDVHPRRQLKKGFTLIELLVVIAIIGLLSAVVLAALSSARTRSKDAAVKEEVDQMRTVFEEEYSDTGSYSNLESHYPAGGGGWFSSASQCSTVGFGGNYASQMTNICTGLLNSLSGVNCGGGGYCLYMFYPYGTGGNAYAIMAYLPGATATANNPRWLCVGSSGATSISDGNFISPGCYNNP